MNPNENLNENPTIEEVTNLLAYIVEVEGMNERLSAENQKLSRSNAAYKAHATMRRNARRATVET